MYKNVPNILSISRMFLSIITLCFFWQPVVCLVLYIITALTDTFDGLIARKYHLETELGALFDSIADHIFYAVIIILAFLLIDLTDLPIILIFIALVVLVRGANCVICYCRFHRVGFIHSWANKITGFLLMASMPFFIFFGVLPVWFIIGFSILATVTALDETAILLTSEKYEVNRKAFFWKE